LPADAPQVPGYKLLRVLGDGGFSVVYLASHTATGELRALKVGPLDDPGRFRREVQTLGAISGPHVVRCHEHGELPGHFWIAMEYLGEYTLADLIRTRPTTEQALLLAEQVLRGLETLHNAGIIHRDLKPENAVVDDAFKLRLIDFGLAKPLPGSPARTVSMTAGLVGTPRYMSPEQIRDLRTITVAADLWAFGCILLELLTGRSPFESDNIMALGHEILTKVIRVKRAELPAEVYPFLGRCLERDPVKRWANAGEALREFVPVADEVRRRLRHERSRESWGIVLQKGLLERFAAEHRGQLPKDAPSQFLVLARQEGLLEVDQERLHEILAPVFDAQQRVVQAEKALQQAKQQLQQNATTMSADALTQQVGRIAELEKIQLGRTAEVRRTVEELLMAETREWGERQRHERQRQQQEEAVRLQETEELEERQTQEANSKPYDPSRTDTAAGNSLPIPPDSTLKDRVLFPICALGSLLFVYLGVLLVVTGHIISGFFPLLVFFVFMIGHGLAAVAVWIQHSYVKFLSGPVQAAFSKGDYDLAINLLNEVKKSAKYSFRLGNPEEESNQLLAIVNAKRNRSPS
jgi:serine/threonine-protein kinase